MNENLENLEYLHLCLIEAVAKRLSIRANAVVANSALNSIVYTIQDDAMASLDAIGLMADVAVQRYEAVLQREREIQATQVIRVRNYWESLLTPPSV